MAGEKDCRIGGLPLQVGEHTYPSGKGDSRCPRFQHRAVHRTTTLSSTKKRCERDSKFTAALRRRARRRRTRDRQERYPDAAKKLHHRALDTDLPARTPRQNPDLEPEPPPPRAPRVRDLLQPAPTTPNPEASGSAPPTTRTDQRAGTHQTPGGPPTRPTRRNPARVPTRVRRRVRLGPTMDALARA
jgi:hypothetical protein